MPTITTGIFFCARQAPQASADAAGFKLVLRVVDRQGTYISEPYEVTWRGDEARSWWAAHANQIKAGTPLQLSLLNPRSFPTRMGAPETHAAVQACALAPVAPSWLRNPTPTINQPHAA